jgi:thiol:disulfide interchange protein DsbD
MPSHQWIKKTALILLFSLAASVDSASAGTNPASPSELLSKPQTIVADVVSVWTAWSVNTARPGDRFALAVVLDVEPGYHITADSGQIKPVPDFSPFPTQVMVPSPPAGLLIEQPVFPSAHAVNLGFIREPLMVFDQRTIIYLPVKIKKQPTLKEIRVSVTVAYQACDAQVCLFPRKIEVPVTLPLAADGVDPQIINPDLFAGYSQIEPAPLQDTVGFSIFGFNFSVSAIGGWGLVLLLVIAAVGGMLLNLTPCVLPLIPIKIISLSNACQNRRRCFALGFFMFLGVIFFWIALGATMSLASGFTATNQLFQYPAFTILVGVVIAVMAVGMCGLFSIRLPNFVYRLNPEQSTLAGSFGLGVLTAILSTPCTAPFMGAAAVWATSQHPITTATVFAAIGTGMALPYVVLSALPEWVGKMPRTGPVSDLVKQVMGIFLLAAAAYFVGSGVSAVRMTPPAPPGQGYWWVVMGFVASAGLWLAYRTVRIASGRSARIVFVVIGILLATGSVYGGLRLTDRGPIDWVYYTPQRFQEARERNQIVVMVFTAEWCLNCKALEQSVLFSDSIVRLFASEDIVPIKVDITGRNESGRAKLQEVGHLTIPLMIIYSPSGQELFRSDFYTSEQIVDAVNRAREGKSISRVNSTQRGFRAV